MTTGTNPRVLSADSIEGNKVVNRNGEDLGKIESIMVNIGGGDVAYAVLSFGGFMGMGDKLFAIPWSALALDTDQERFILDVDKEKLKNAPGFDKDHWPNMADPQFQTDVHSYYGTQPMGYR